MWRVEQTSVSSIYCWALSPLPIHHHHHGQRLNMVRTRERRMLFAPTLLLYPCWVRETGMPHLHFSAPWIPSLVNWQLPTGLLLQHQQDFNAQFDKSLNLSSHWAKLFALLDYFGPGSAKKSVKRAERKGRRMRSRLCFVKATTVLSAWPGVWVGRGRGLGTLEGMLETPSLTLQHFSFVWQRI